MAISLETIKGFDSFGNIFRTGKRFRFSYIGAFVIFNENLDKNIEFISHNIFYGVTISKKIAKKAVLRNRIKRLMRESIRVCAKEIEFEKLVSIDTILFNCHYSPQHSMQICLQDVLPAIKNILLQANLYYCKKNV